MLLDAAACNACNPQPGPAREGKRIPDEGSLMERPDDQKRYVWPATPMALPAVALAPRADLEVANSTGAIWSGGFTA